MKSIREKLEMLPIDVVKRFALEQARSAEHLAKDCRAKECNNVNEKYLNGDVSRAELMGAMSDSLGSSEVATYAAFASATDEDAIDGATAAASYYSDDADDEDAVKLKQHETLDKLIKENEEKENG